MMQSGSDSYLLSGVWINLQSKLELKLSRNFILVKTPNLEDEHHNSWL